MQYELRCSVGLSIQVEVALLLVLKNSSASHYNDVCKPVSVCELLGIESIGPQSNAVCAEAAAAAAAAARRVCARVCARALCCVFRMCAGVKVRVCGGACARACASTRACVTLDPALARRVPASEVKKANTLLTWLHECARARARRRERVCRHPKSIKPVCCAGLMLCVCANTCLVCVCVGARLRVRVQKRVCARARALSRAS